MLVVIAGLGNVGRHLLKKFSDYNANIIIIEKDKHKIDKIKQQHDVLVKEGNMLSHFVLRGANVGACDFFIACSDADGDNIVACQLAERMGAKTTVARISSEEIFPYDVNELEDYLNIDWLISPSRLSGYNLAFYLHQNADIGLDNYFSNQMDVAKLTISSSCAAKNKKINKFIKHRDLSLVAYCRNEQWTLGKPNDGDDVFHVGDQVVVVGVNQRMSMLLPEIYPEVYKKGEKIYIAGSSDSCLFTLSILKGKNNITLFEKDEEKCDKLESTFNIKVINLDASDFNQLKEYNPNTNGVFICASTNDGENLTYALNAEDLGFQTVIPIVNENDKIRLFKRFSFSHYIAPPYLASKEIFRCFSQTMMEDFEFMEGLPIYAMVKDVRKDSKWLGLKIELIISREDGSFAVVAIRRRGMVLLVDEKLLKNDKTNQLQVGDKVLMISTSDKHHALLKSISSE